MAEKFTATQQRFVDLLSDGEPHHREELRRLLPDAELGGYDSVKVHVCHIRKILRRRGEDIVSERRGQDQFYYRMARLMASPYSS